MIITPFFYNVVLNDGRIYDIADTWHAADKVVTFLARKGVQASIRPTYTQHIEVIALPEL